MAPVDESFNRYAPRMPKEPVLVIDGRRSFVAAWPPGAVCEECGVEQPRGGGYVGPVLGERVDYPKPDARYTCPPCARAKLGLGERELSGHMCQHCEDDSDLHIDGLRFLPGELDSMSDAERLEHVSAKYEYAERGWQVLEVESAPQLTAGTGVGWAVYFKAARQLW